MAVVEQEGLVPAPAPEQAPGTPVAASCTARASLPGTPERWDAQVGESTPGVGVTVSVALPPGMEQVTEHLRHMHAAICELQRQLCFCVVEQQRQRADIAALMLQQASALASGAGGGAPPSGEPPPLGCPPGLRRTRSAPPELGRLTEGEVDQAYGAAAMPRERRRGERSSRPSSASRGVAARAPPPPPPPPPPLQYGGSSSSTCPPRAVYGGGHLADARACDAAAEDQDRPRRQRSAEAEERIARLEAQLLEITRDLREHRERERAHVVEEISIATPTRRICLPGEAVLGARLESEPPSTPISVRSVSTTCTPRSMTKDLAARHRQHHEDSAEASARAPAGRKRKSRLRTPLPAGAPLGSAAAAGSAGGSKMPPPTAPRLPGSANYDRPTTLDSLAGFVNLCEQNVRRALDILMQLHWSVHLSGAMLGISVLAAVVAMLCGVQWGTGAVARAAAAEGWSLNAAPAPGRAPSSSPPRSSEDVEACVRHGGQNCFDVVGTVTTTVGVGLDALLGARPASTTPGPPGSSVFDPRAAAAGARPTGPGRRGPPSTTVKPGTRIPQVVVEYLRHVGLPDVWTTDSAGNTILHLATGEGRFDVIHALLGSSVFTALDAQDGQGNTALHIAAQRGHFQSAVHIMRCGRFTQAAKQNFAGRTALHLAASSPVTDAHSEVALLLLSEMPPGTPDLADNRGRTALHLAALSGHRRLATAFMLSTKFTLGAKQDNKGMTALHCAASKGHVGVVEALLKPRVAQPNQGKFSQGIDLDARDFKGRTALDLAIALKSVEVAIAIQASMPAIIPGPSAPTSKRAWPLPFEGPTERTVLTGKGPRQGKWTAPSSEGLPLDSDGALAGAAH